MIKGSCITCIPKFTEQFFVGKYLSLWYSTKCKKVLHQDCHIFMVHFEMAFKIPFRSFILFPH